MLKIGGEATRSNFDTILNKWLEESEIPNDWKDAGTVLLE